MAVILCALIIAYAVPMSCIASTPPHRGGEGYNPDHPESYDSIKEQYHSLIQERGWASFLQRIKEDHLLGLQWTDQSGDAACTIFVAAIDSFLVSLNDAAANALTESSPLLDSAFSLDSSRFLVDAISRKDDTLVKSKIALFKAESIQGRVCLFRFIPPGICWSGTAIDESDRVRLFLLADAIYGILIDGVSVYRKATLYHIHNAAMRWQQFTSDVTCSQYPWETFLNGFLGPGGDLEHPPIWQWSLLHASPALEIREANLQDPWKPLEDTKVSEALGISLIGVNWYRANAGGFDQKIGIAAYVSLTDDLDPPGWGVSTKWGKVVQVGYVQRGGEIHSGAVVVGVDFWSFLEKKQSSFTRKRTEFLDNAKAAVESLTTDPLSILR